MALGRESFLATYSIWGVADMRVLHHTHLEDRRSIVYTTLGIAPLR